MPWRQGTSGHPGLDRAAARVYRAHLSLNAVSKTPISGAPGCTFDDAYCDGDGCIEWLPVKGDL